MFYVYILQSSKNGAYYIGSCKDIVERLRLHNEGLVHSTKRFLPWHCVHKERYLSLSDARKRELKIKSWKKRAAIEKLIKHF